VNQSVPSTALASRDAIAKTPPFGEEICCLAGFLGETGDSGPNPGLEIRADNGRFFLPLSALSA